MNANKNIGLVIVGHRCSAVKGHHDIRISGHNYPVFKLPFNSLLELFSHRQGNIFFQGAIIAFSAGLDPPMSGINHNSFNVSFAGGAGNYFLTNPFSRRAVSSSRTFTVPERRSFSHSFSWLAFSGCCHIFQLEIECELKRILSAR